MVQPTSKRLVTEATVAAHVATQVTTPGSATATALSATYALKSEAGSPLASAAQQSLASLATTERTASLARSRVDYEDNAGFTEEWADLTAWEANAGVTANKFHLTGGWGQAQRRLVGIESSPARIIGSINVTTATAALDGLALVGVSKNATTGYAEMVNAGFFAVGVTSNNLPWAYPSGSLSSTPLAPGTYRVSVVVTPTEIVGTLYSDDLTTYYRKTTTLASFGTPLRVGVYDTDPRGASGHTVGPVAARIGYASAKPRGTVETQGRWTHYKVPPANNDNALIATPANYDSRKPLPWVIYSHGVGDMAETAMSQPAAIRPVLDALVDAGYGVAAADFGGNNWGSPTAVATMVALYKHLRDSYNIGPIVLLGHSMGGLVSLSTLATRAIPGVVGWVGIEPVVSLEAMYRHPIYESQYGPSVRTAYGMASDSEYATKSAGYDPALRAAADFQGVPMLLFASPSDTVVTKTLHTDVLKAKAQTVQPDVTLVTTSGGHVDPTHFQPSVVVNFVNRVTKV